MSDLKVGDKVICLTDYDINYESISKDEHYTIQNTVQCSCGVKCVDIGKKVVAIQEIKCSCGKTIGSDADRRCWTENSDTIWWFGTYRFMKESNDSGVSGFMNIFKDKN